MEKNRLLLAECLKEIEKSLGWGESAAWTNDDLENLSEKIWEKTETRLSLSTMRRIWGRVKYDNFPNTATLNALAVFAGYPDWRTFCSKQEIGDTALEENIPAEQPRSGSGISMKVGVNRNRKMWIAVFNALAVLIILPLALRQKQPHKIDYSYPFAFTARKVTDDLPNSVVFTYDAGSFPGAIVRIQQSWDSSRNEIVDGGGKNHTSIYYYPGYFKAKLIINDSIVKQTPVFIKTKGWKGIAEKEDLPVYFSEVDIWQNNMLSISGDLCRKAFGTMQFNDKWVQFANIREFPGIEGDDFKFEAVLRNVATEQESLCRRIKVLLLGTRSPVIIPLAVTGCVANINAYIADSVINGRNHDLSAFGCNFAVPQRLKYEMSPQGTRVYLNAQLLMEMPPSKSIGQLVGIRILFEGPGEITQAQLSDSKGITYDLMEKK